MSVNSLLPLSGFATALLHVLNNLLAGDFAVKALGDIGVVANDDEDRRGFLLCIGCLLDVCKAFFPLACQCDERAFRFPINRLRLRFSSAQPVCRQNLAVNRFPESEEPRFRSAGTIANRQARNFGNAALNRIYQTEIANQPRERRTFGMSAALDVKRGSGEIDAKPHAAGLVHPVQAANPHGGFFALFSRVRRQLFARGRGPIGVMPFIVQHHEWGASIEFA